MQNRKEAGVKLQDAPEGEHQTQRVWRGRSKPEAVAEIPLEDKIDNILLHLNLNILQQKMDSYNWYYKI